MTKQMLLCLTNSPLHAHQVVDWLKQEGFPTQDISACVPEKNVTCPAFAKSREVASNSGTVSFSRTDDWTSARQITVLGRRLSKSAKSVTKSFNRGSMADFLIDNGFSEPDARRYEVEVQGGGILISVHTASRAKLRRAKEILEMAGTQNIAAVTAGCRNWLQTGMAVL
ncbi:MAG: hypothetical protein K0Q55_1025 [Verrucomicrobia bacterium]|nr:hypothetical protein [Verrucomicrobiota bacterium]